MRERFRARELPPLRAFGQAEVTALGFNNHDRRRRRGLAGNLASGKIIHDPVTGFERGLERVATRVVDRPVARRWAGVYLCERNPGEWLELKIGLLDLKNPPQEWKNGRGGCTEFAQGGTGVLAHQQVGVLQRGGERRDRYVGVRLANLAEGDRCGGTNLRLGIGECIGQFDGGLSCAGIEFAQDGRGSGSHGDRVDIGRGQTPGDDCGEFLIKPAIDDLRSRSLGSEPFRHMRNGRCADLLQPFDRDRERLIWPGQSSGERSR